MNPEPGSCFLSSCRILVEFLSLSLPRWWGRLKVAFTTRLRSCPLVSVKCLPNDLLEKDNLHSIQNSDWPGNFWLCLPNSFSMAIYIFLPCNVCSTTWTIQTPTLLMTFFNVSVEGELMAGLLKNKVLIKSINANWIEYGGPFCTFLSNITSFDQPQKGLSIKWQQTDWAKNKA